MLTKYPKHVKNCYDIFRGVTKTVRLVKVLWQHHGVEEATWEREDTMLANYPFLFKEADTFLVIDI